MGVKTLKGRAKIERDADSIWNACAVSVMQPNHAAIGIAMRNERKRVSVSLRGLAKRMDISAPYLGDLELGRRSWTQERLVQYLTELERKS